MRTLRLKLLILVTPFALFSVPSYGESKEAPVEMVTRTHNRVLVQANKDGPRLAIDEKEAEASASGREVSHCNQGRQSSSAKGRARTSIDKPSELGLEVNLESAAFVRGGYYITCQESDPRQFPCDTGGCLGNVTHNKLASADVSSSARVEFRLPAADSPDYRIKISKSGSSDLVATLMGPDGKEIRLNEPGGKEPVLRRASKGSYYLNLELPAVASKKGQDREELEKSATVRVQLTALPAHVPPKPEAPKPEAAKPETAKPETSKPEAPKSETPKSEPPKSEPPKSKK
ncbi:MAG TPA: hypothetical protein VJM47_06650 [Nitrosospira sp.]|nr:hypothetical protein [Nitrosospira sp.]